MEHNTIITGVFLITKDGRTFPENQEGYTGFFSKNERGTPQFTMTEDGKKKNIYNLLHYIALDEDGEQIIFN